MHSNQGMQSQGPRRAAGLAQRCRRPHPSRATAPPRPQEFLLATATLSDQGPPAPTLSSSAATLFRRLLGHVSRSWETGFCYFRLPETGSTPGWGSCLA